VHTVVVDVASKHKRLVHLLAIYGINCTIVVSMFILYKFILLGVPPYSVACCWHTL
jgi:hypothetical protein